VAVFHLHSNNSASRCTGSEDRAVAAGHSVELAGWQVIFDELMRRVAGRFGRVEPRPTARDYLLGLLSGIECKLLEPGRACRHAGPQAMQRMLCTARATTSDPARAPQRDTRCPGGAESAASPSNRWRCGRCADQDQLRANQRLDQPRQGLRHLHGRQRSPSPPT
jgi:hypothetical protein